MRDAHQAQTKRYQNMITVFLLMILTYLMFHLFFSERSIPTLLSLNIQQQSLGTQLASVSHRQADILDKVVRLRPETLDSDLVEEYAIKMLGQRPQGGMIVVDES